MLKEFDNKKILILGFAREGIDTLNFLLKLYPYRSFGVADRLKAGDLSVKANRLISKHQKQLDLFLGDDYLKAIKDYDVIIKSPGIPLAVISRYLTRGNIVTSQMKIFFDRCPGKIVGVTGTKGKSTTTSLIYAILKEANEKVHLLGNIGQPVLTSLLAATAKDIYACELSSHQLSDLQKSPHIAVFLNIFPEHLDYYEDYKGYQKAKTSICRYQNRGDYLIYNPDSAIVKHLIKCSPAHKLPFRPADVYKYISKKDISLRGEDNLFNISAAIKVGELFNVDKDSIRQAIKNFKPLLHRLEFVGRFKRVDFYNDSLATLPEATISAINAFDGRVDTLITGGFDRGLSYLKLAKRIIRSPIKNIVFFPTTGGKIWDIINRHKMDTRHFNVLFTDKMEDAVNFGYKHTKKGAACLMSCASASFNLFKDYRARGNSFKRYVKKIASS